MSDTPSIGIDLGTTNSAVAIAEARDFNVLPNAAGNRLTPSVVAFDGEDATVGREAANQAAQYPDRTVFSVKRYIGTDETILIGESGHKSEFTPEELSALILKKLKSDTEAYLDGPVESAVITVPAYFNDRERQATKHAGEIAGLTVDRILNEPTAACLAYGLRTGDESTVLVYDLGGGTFDVSLIQITAGVFEVVATNGDTKLGGDDWGGKIVDWLVDQIQRDHDVTVKGNSATNERLFEAAKQAKHELSSRQQATVNLPFLEIESETYDVECTLDRETFQDISDDLTERTIDICEVLFADTEYMPKAVDEVLLVGGATRMPHIRSRVARYFGQAPSKSINPDEAVALGAAAQAAILDQRALPVPDSGESDILTPRDEADESPTTRDASDIVLLDVTPQSLGLESVYDINTLDTRYEVLIPRNTPIPARETAIHSTVKDNQEYVTFPVYQGEGSLEKAEQLDEFEIGPIPPRPAGEPDIEVEFRFDQDGLLQVSAEDLDHEIGESIAIESVFGFTRDEIDAMQRNLPAIR